MLEVKILIRGAKICSVVGWGVDLHLGLIEVLYPLAGLYWHYFASINVEKSDIGDIGCICICAQNHVHQCIPAAHKQ